MSSITITIFWNPRDKESAQRDMQTLVDILEDNSNTEPPQLENQLGLIRADCAGLEVVEGFGQ